MPSRSAVLRDTILESDRRPQPLIPLSVTSKFEAWVRARRVHPRRHGPARRASRGDLFHPARTGTSHNARWNEATPVARKAVAAGKVGRTTGPPFLNMFSVRSIEFRITKGQARRFNSTAKSDRSFCPRCGTQLTGEHAGFLRRSA